MTRSLSLRGYVIAAILLVLPFFAFAQEQEAPLTIQVPPAPELEVHNITVHNTALLGQEDGMFKVALSLTNEEDRVQSGILYEIALMNGENTGVKFEGTKEVTLGAKDTFSDVASLPLRHVEPGAYVIAVTAYSRDGVFLGQTFAGDMMVTEADKQAAMNTEYSAGESVGTAIPASKPVPHKNIHLIISVIALALALLVVVLAASRHKKPVSNQ